MKHPNSTGDPSAEDGQRYMGQPSSQSQGKREKMGGLEGHCTLHKPLNVRPSTQLEGASSGHSLVIPAQERQRQILVLPVSLVELVNLGVLERNTISETEARGNDPQR